MQELEHRAINKIDNILKSFRLLLRIKVLISKLLKKEEKFIDFNNDVLVAKNLLKQNQNAKIQYQNNIRQVLSLYNQYKHLKIWPRLFSRLNEALIENSIKINQDNYISQKHFTKENLLYEIFYDLQNSNFQSLKKFYKRICFFQLDFDLQIKIQTKKRSLQIRQSQLFRKHKLQSISVSPIQAKQNICFLQAAKFLQKHTQIIPCKQKTVQTFQFCQFSFIKNLLLNVEALLKNMQERNSRISKTITQYQKNYYKRHQNIKLQNKVNIKKFTQNIRNIKNNANNTKLQRQSSKISMVNKIGNKKTSLFLYNLNLDVLRQDIDHSLKKTKFQASVQQISDIQNQCCQNLISNQNQTISNRKRKISRNMGLNLRNENRRNSIMQKNIQLYLQKKQKRKKNLENGMIGKTKKYIFEQDNLQNKQNRVKKLEIGSSSKLNLKKWSKITNSKKQDYKQIPLFIMVKNNVNLHGFSSQQYRQRIPFLTLQQFTKKQCLI